MSLHHRRECADMRSAYGHSKTRARQYPSESDSDRSYRSGSDRSYHTTPTSYSSSPAKRPPIVHYNTCDTRQDDLPPQYFYDREPQQSPPASPSSSVETYASTVESEEDFQEDVPEYDVPEYTARPYESTALPATPSDFSELFPSHRRLDVRHDDSTLDGNMNLRIDTDVSIQGRRCNMTLFHLRMHDLKNREFSLRRYCRDSGREVCHSVRKHQKPVAERRPGFQRSLSNALSSMRPKPEQRNSTGPSSANLKRNDSGYASMHSVDFDEDDRPKSAGKDSQTPEQSPTNNIKLEFSNYAQVNIKRTGVAGNKRYEFEYWGVDYAWKRVSHKDRGSKGTSYHLTRTGSDQVLAYIKPVPLTHRQVEEERNKGGWIPPCSMWIADERICRSQKDVADVVIACGLMALVDDSIHTHFHSVDSKQLLIPVSKLQMGVEYIGPKRLINGMFKGKDSSSVNQSRPSSSHGSSPASANSPKMRVSPGSSRQPSYGY